jgi:outer membrane protein assembly factor BamB
MRIIPFESIQRRGFKATRLVLTSLLVCFYAAGVQAQEWPHWRGPERNDRSSENGLMKEWPKDGPPLKWLYKDAGRGFAGFSIVADRLFSMGQHEDKQYAFCLDASTGKEIWRTELSEAFKEQFGDGPRSTPTVDGKFVYCMTAVGTLACLELETGQRIWQIKMQDFGGAIPQWGYAESPLVDGDLVVCTPGGAQGAMLAVNKVTGEKVWQSAPVTTQVDNETSPPAKAHYSSILPITWNDKRQFVQLTVLAIIGVDAEDGTILWQEYWPGRIAVIPSPIFDKGQIFVTSGYGIGSKLIQLEAEHQVKELWFTRTMMNHHGGVVLLDDHFYGSSERGFVCQKRSDGKIAWANRKIRKGALVYADGHFYHVQEDDGRVRLFTANATQPESKGSFVLAPQSKSRKGGKVWVHPVIANGRLFLRDQEFIYCYDIKQPK